MEWSNAHLEEIVSLRRRLHAMPELSEHEHKTQEFVLEKLRSLHPDRLQTIGTGVKAVFFGEGATRTLAFRADMDALPIEEQTGMDFASGHDGCMHACGHDGHMACLLGLAMRIAQHRQALPCNVVLIFQPAEECMGGARKMVEGGVLRDPDVDAIFALHIMPYIPQGVIASKAGPFMAQSNEFNIRIHGKASHGAQPQRGVDAIVAAGTLIGSLQTIISRNTDPRESGVLTIGKLTAGEARNIVAKEALLEGTLRSYTRRQQDEYLRRIDAQLRGLEMTFGVRAEYSEITSYPAVNNDAGLFVRAQATLGELLIPTHALMISEDFSFYQQKVPGLMLFLGSGNEEKGFNHSLHTPRFNFDEAILAIGVHAFWQLLLAEGAR